MVGFVQCIKLIFVLVNILISISILTLFERKILSYAQNRKGPKKISIGGILQPISDGVKLILKKFVIISNSKKFKFFILPVFSFFFMFICWKFYPFFFNNLAKSFSVLIILCISSLSTYVILFSGWVRKSKYRFIGSIRGAAQKISYEIRLILIILSPCCFKFALDLNLISIKAEKIFLLVFPLFVIWLINCIAELNRAPFDFAEGESELVSGFKTEYSSLKFAFLSLSEYGMILFLGFLSSILFVCGKFLKKILMGLFFTFIFVLIRARYPRLRYDLLKILAWKFFLPLGILYLNFVY